MALSVVFKFTFFRSSNCCLNMFSSVRFLQGCTAACDVGYKSWYLWKNFDHPSLMLIADF